MYKRQHKKSFWGGVITGVLAAALIVSGVFLGQSVWNLYQSTRTQETAAPVSYTHLDVYKRQELFRKFGRNRNSVYLLADTQDNLEVLQEIVSEYQDNLLIKGCGVYEMCIRDSCATLVPLRVYTSESVPYKDLCMDGTCLLYTSRCV